MANDLSFGLPAYPGGKAYPVMSDGCGLADDILTPGPADDCRILVVEDTTVEAFLGYCGTLLSNGFSLTFQREESSGLYREMTRENELVYLYYIPAEHCARIIIDRAGLPLRDFAAQVNKAPPGGETLMQFGLYYDEMVPGVTCDCGMLYAMRLSNGEFIIIDGGEYEQATDAACAEFMRRLKAQSNTDKITVALWLCTHAHNDHMDFFVKFLRVYKNGVVLKRVMFNFPSHAELPMAPYVSRLKERLADFEGVRYLKPHTGQKCSLSGTEIEIMLTQEDVIHPDAAKKYAGMNQTSTVVRLACPDFSFTVLGDIPEENGEKLIRRYTHKELNCTFLQAAHHCINRIEAVYDFVRAKYVLIPERTGIIKKNMRENYEVILQFHPEEAVLCAGDATRVFSFRDGVLQTESYPATSGPYDGSEI